MINCGKSNAAYLVIAQSGQDEDREVRYQIAMALASHLAIKLRDVLGHPGFRRSAAQVGAKRPCRARNTLLDSRSVPRACASTDFIANSQLFDWSILARCQCCFIGFVLCSSVQTNNKHHTYRSVAVIYTICSFEAKSIHMAVRSFVFRPNAAL